MRNKFINFLIDQKNIGKDLFLLVGDLGFSVVEPFSDLYPDCLINIGVAEQNMAGIAAGIASEGKTVFTYSIGNFNTFRCAEQIRNDIDYHDFPVCTVTVGGGVAYGNMGYSHHAIQDFSLMRSMPNTLICAPCDPIETELCLDLIIKRSRPSYLRLHKANEPILNDEKEALTPGVPRYIDGKKNCRKLILTTGYATQGGKNLLKNNNKLSEFILYSLPCWGMNCTDNILKFLENFTEIITIEDHLKSGGFGSWILECLNQGNLNPKITIKGFEKNIIGKVGDEKYLLDYANLFKI